MRVRKVYNRIVVQGVGCGWREEGGGVGRKGSGWRWGWGGVGGEKERKREWQTDR